MTPRVCARGRWTRCAVGSGRRGSMSCRSRTRRCRFAIAWLARDRQVIQPGRQRRLADRDASDSRGVLPHPVLPRDGGPLRGASRPSNAAAKRLCRASAPVWSAVDAIRRAGRLRCATRSWATYDICEDKRLAKVYKIMRGYGDHLQYSVFECQLTQAVRSRGPIEAATSRRVKSRVEAFPRLRSRGPIEACVPPRCSAG